jgi:hypothetical protein
MTIDIFVQENLSLSGKAVPWAISIGTGSTSHVRQVTLLGRRQRGLQVRDAQGLWRCTLRRLADVPAQAARMSS